MNKKTIILIASIVVIAVVVSALLISEIQNQNPKIFCYARENLTSNWYKTEHCPALASYDYGSQNFSSLPHVNLGVSIFNNSSKSLFNVVIEVLYRTAENKWNMTAKTDIGFLDIQQYKQTQITLTNPYLLLWHTKRPKYNGITIWENVTIPVLNASDYKITAYGFAKP